MSQPEPPFVPSHVDNWPHAEMGQTSEVPPEFVAILDPEQPASPSVPPRLANEALPS